MFDLSRLRFSNTARFAITILVIAVAAAVLLFNTFVEHNVSISGNALVVKGMFSANIPLDQIKSVELKEEAPRIETRTNGLGFGDIQRGWFRVSELGKGQLFLHLDSKPFLYVITGNGFVIINFKDSQRTQALYKELMDRLKT